MAGEIYKIKFNDINEQLIRLQKSKKDSAKVRKYQQ